MHSVPLFRLRDSLLTSTFIGQTRRHFPQWTHLLSSQWTRRIEKQWTEYLRDCVVDCCRLKNTKKMSGIAFFCSKKCCSQRKASSNVAEIQQIKQVSFSLPQRDATVSNNKNNRSDAIYLRSTLFFLIIILLLLWFLIFSQHINCRADANTNHNPPDTFQDQYHLLETQ